MNRRVDRIKSILEGCEDGRARVSEVLEKLRQIESNSELPGSSVYIAVQQQNQKLSAEGRPAQFVTSQEGEVRGFIRLAVPSVESSEARSLRDRVEKLNAQVNDRIREWLQAMSWEEFEDGFLKEVLEGLGFQDIEITPKRKDGNVDARATYKRGIVEAEAIIQAKHWSRRASIGVDEIQRMRGTGALWETAIIITTAKFTDDAVREARNRQQNRSVTLIDGDTLVEVCKTERIGVKEVELPKLLMIDNEVASTGQADAESGSVLRGQTNARRRLRKEMLGDSQKGLSVGDLAALLDLSDRTVRVYLGQPDRKNEMFERIRSDQGKRKEALAIVSRRRSD